MFNNYIRFLLVLLAIYVDSYSFLFSAGIVEFGFGVNTSSSVCSTAVILCIWFYMTTKVSSDTSCEAHLKCMTNMISLYKDRWDKIMLKLT